MDEEADPTVNTSTTSPPTWGDAAFEWVFRLLKVYGYVVGVFLVAFVAAYFASVADVAWQLSGGDSDIVIHHWAWVAGAILAAIGQPLGWIKVSGMFQEKASPAEDDERFQRAYEEEQKDAVPSSAISSAAFLGFVGAFVGMLFGGTLILIWFSLALSPFSPETWSGSIEAMSADDIDPAAPAHERRNVSGLKTSNRIPFYLGVTPIVVLAIAGVLIGGIGGAMGLVTHTKS